MNKPTKVLIGGAMIFTAGILTGILLAPDKGERTRRRIARKCRGLYGNATLALEEGKDDLDEIKDRLKDKLSTVQEELDKLSNCPRKS